MSAVPQTIRLQHGASEVTIRPDGQRLEIGVRFGKALCGSHTFTSIGTGPWQDFLASCDAGYLREKLFPGATVVDFHGTMLRLWSLCREFGDDPRVPQIKALARVAAESRRDIGSGEPVPLHEEDVLSHLVEGLRRLGVEDPGGIVKRKPRHEVTDFFRKTWPRHLDQIAQTAPLAKAVSASDLARIERDRDLFLHGHCYPMALALHQLTGLPIVTLVATRSLGRNQVQANHPAHVWVEVDAETALDASGTRPVGGILSEYLDGHKILDWRLERHETAEAWRAMMDDLAGDDATRSGFSDMMDGAVPKALDFARDHVPLSGIDPVLSSSPEGP